MGIKVDLSQLQDFQNKINVLNGEQRREFFRNNTNELGNRLIALVKPQTPVITGTLRNSWASTPVTENADSYSMDLYNSQEYSEYVEHGHRQTPGRYVPAIGKRLVASWVEGTHMLEKSENQLEPIAPKTIEGNLDRLLRTVF